jgi:UDP-glucose 4-epimerase
MSGEKILITGGCGFIGANLVKYLLDRGRCQITVYDNLSVGSKSNLERAIADSGSRNSSVDFVEGDILDKDRLGQAVIGHSAVVHLAAHTRVVESLKNPQESFDVNVVGTFNVLEAARTNGSERFVFASSNAAVGEQSLPINEEMACQPLSPYGAGKLSGEALCSAYFRSYGLDTASLRFANAYGPYSEHKTSVVAKFIGHLRDGKSLEIYGDGEQTRDFIHAHDICQALYLCLTRRQSRDSQTTDSSGVFQIATGVETRIIDLATMVKRLANGAGNEQSEVVYESSRPGEIRRNCSNIGKSVRVLGFSPTVELEQGIQNLITPATDSKKGL